MCNRCKPQGGQICTIGRYVVERVDSDGADIFAVTYATSRSVILSRHGAPHAALEAAKRYDAGDRRRGQGPYALNG